MWHVAGGKHFPNLYSKCGITVLAITLIKRQRSVQHARQCSTYHTHTHTHTPFPSSSPHCCRTFFGLHIQSQTTDLAQLSSLSRSRPGGPRLIGRHMVWHEHTSTHAKQLQSAAGFAVCCRLLLVMLIFNTDRQFGWTVLYS